MFEPRMMNGAIAPFTIRNLAIAFHRDNQKGPRRRDRRRTIAIRT